MIISRGRNYIFVHIPKTGGTSLAHALEARARKDDLMLGDTPKAVKRRKRLSGAASAGRLWKHATLADIEGVVTRQEIARMFTFALVRNPWDRMVSYYHWLQSQSFDHPAVGLAQRPRFANSLPPPLLPAPFRASPAPSQYPRPAGDEHWSGLVDHDQVVVRHDRWAGFSCHVDDLPGYLQIAAGQRRPPLPLLVCGESATDRARLAWPVKLLPGQGREGGV